MSRPTRRDLLMQGLWGLAGLTAPAARALSQPAFRDYPFSLGVASGDPLPDRIVLWTRIAPEPFQGGGMPMQPVPVRWEVASDTRMNRVVAKGETLARPEIAHSVHVDVSGLSPGREYWYRFYAGGEASQIGRTKTLPAPDESVRQLRFGVAGCQSYEDGYYTAYRHLADEQFDLVFHYGDYIYEVVAPPPEVGIAIARELPPPAAESYSLDDYRNRYAAYKVDPDLQAAHESTPFVVSFDDHEVDNNWAGDNDQDETPPELFLLRRAAAFQAYYEHMPLRATSMPRGSEMRMYRNFRIGDLAAFNVLDTRQYRSNRPCVAPNARTCDDPGDPKATMLGAEQERWLLEGLGQSDTHWNVLAQQVLMMRFFLPYPDGWDSADAARQRLFESIRQRDIQNVVVLTGDIHSHWAAELKADFDDESSQTVGCEFVGTSITSGGDHPDRRLDGQSEQILASAPHIKFLDGQRGYLSVELTPQLWQTHFRGVDYVSRPGAPLATRASFVIENGKPALQRS